MIPASFVRVLVFGFCVLAAVEVHGQGNGTAAPPSEANPTQAPNMTGSNTGCQTVFPERPHRINTVRLDLPYCAIQTTLTLEPKEGSGEGPSWKLNKSEDFFKYKLTDVRSDLDYFFDSVKFVDEDSKIEDDYKFLNKSARILITHVRTIPGEHGYSRYFIISRAIGPTKDKSEKFKLLNGTDTLLKLKLKSILPDSAERVNRYDGAGPDSCSNAFTFVEFVEKQKIAEEEYKNFQRLAMHNWKPSPIAWNVTNQTNSQVRFDCKRPSNVKGGTASVQLRTTFQIFQFLVAAILLKSF